MENANLKMIIEKYHKTGFAPINERSPLMGDLTDVPDLMNARDRITQANEDFARIDPKIRKRFDNDPFKLMRFLNDQENREEAIAIGLIPKPVKASEPVPEPPEPVKSE